MVKEAQSDAAEDQTLRDLIDARNEADALAYQVEKTVNENNAPRWPVGDLEDRGAVAAVKGGGAGRGSSRPSGKPRAESAAACRMDGGRACRSRVRRVLRVASRTSGCGGLTRIRGDEVKAGRDGAGCRTGGHARPSRPVRLLHISKFADVRRRTYGIVSSGSPSVILITCTSGGHRPGAPPWMPPVDIYQTGDQEVVLKAEAAGHDGARQDIRLRSRTAAAPSRARRSSPVT